MPFSPRIVLLALLLTCSVTGAVAQPLPPGTLQVDGASLDWRAAPPGMPAGIQTAVLEGDPRQAGAFTLRLRAPAGVQIAPHTHPSPERVTVLSGAIGVAFGTHADAGPLRVFRGGDFYLNPPGAPHHVRFVEDSVIQITGQGPWKLDYLEAPR